MTSTHHSTTKHHKDKDNNDGKHRPPQDAEGSVNGERDNRDKDDKMTKMAVAVAETEGIIEGGGQEWKVKVTRNTEKESKRCWGCLLSHR